MSRRNERRGWVFNLHDDSGGIPRRLAEGLSARILVGERSMLSVVRIEPHSRGEVHSHPEEQWGVLLEGTCVRIQDGVETAMKPGDVWHTPGGTPHGVYTEEQGALVLDFFSPPRPEYRQAGDGFGGPPEE